MIRTFIVKFASGAIKRYEGTSAAQIRRHIESFTTEPFTFVVFAGG